jgi:hypothetical protein
MLLSFALAVGYITIQAVMCDGSFSKLCHVHDDKGTHFRSTGSVFRLTWCAELWLRHNAQELLLQLMISESGYPL